MYRLMIIDDEPLALHSVAQLVKKYFENCFQITVYENAQEALCYFEQTPADIVLTDIRMPFMDGLELIERMQAISHTFIPIVFSGHSEFVYAKKAMALGVIYYLEKPLYFEELNHSLDAAIRKLQQNQLLQRTVSYRKEEEELFFINLISRQFSAEVITQTFDALHLPFSPDHSAGILLRIHVLAKSATYHYDQETLSNVWENLTRMFLKSQYVCTVYRTVHYYDLILIGRNFTDASLTELQEQANVLLDLKITAKVILRFDSLLGLPGTSRPLDHSAAITMYECEAAALRQDTGSNRHESIRHAIAYMEQHYAEDLTREGVAGIVYMSSYYFSRLFKQETGVSFLDYLTEIRMKRAIVLLNTNMKIRDVGKAVGYSSQNRFNINFRNYTSYTPSEYRRDVLKLYI